MKRIAFILLIAGSTNAFAEMLPSDSASVQVSKFNGFESMGPKTNVVYEVQNHSDRIVSVELTCAGLNRDGHPLDVNESYQNNIAPHAFAYGTTFLSVEVSNIFKVECRITKAEDGK